MVSCAKKLGDGELCRRNALLEVLLLTSRKPCCLQMSFEVKLDPVEGMNAVTQSALTFLATHMPATASPVEEATKVRNHTLPDSVP